MFSARLQDIRKLHKQLHSVVGQLQRALADEKMSRSAFFNPNSQTSDAELTSHVAELHKTRVQKLQGMQSKSLFRPNPDCIVSHGAPNGTTNDAICKAPQVTAEKSC